MLDRAIIYQVLLENQVLLKIFFYNLAMLGKKIKELRKERGLTQQKLANALNVTVQAVSLWEKDKTDPDLINIKLLARFFNITIDELFEEDNKVTYSISNSFNSNSGNINFKG